MHVYPQQGKASGAYMYGAVYDVHPYLLAELQRSVYDDVSTFVHEWGHAVHTMLSQGAQPVRDVRLCDVHRRDCVDDQ